MKIVNRYIFKELLQTFFFTLIAITSLLIVAGLVQKAMSNNVPLAQIFRLIPFVMVEMTRISFPVSILLAVTTFFAKMSGNNEIVALKSLGIAPWQILWPVMVFGTIISLLTVWLNEMAVTWGRTGIETVIYNAAEDILLEQLRTSHTFSSPSKDLNIMVKGVENRRLLSPTITLKSPPTTIEAKFARLKIDFSTQLLTISLSEVKVDVQGGVKYTAEDRTIQVSLDKISARSDSGVKRPSDIGLSEIYREIESHEEEADVFRRKIAARRAFASCMGVVEAWATPELNGLNGEIAAKKKSITRLYTEIPRRWSTGFSCLCFIWLGAPLAIWMRKSDIFASFFACFTPILLIYYPLLMFGLENAKKGAIAPCFVWTGNVCIVLIGFWFLRRIHRY